MNDFEGVEFSAGLKGETPEEAKLEKLKVRFPKDVKPLVRPIANSEQECVMVITLDGNNQATTAMIVTIGLANQSQIHPRETFKWAVRYSACSIVVAHNHPSGNMEPSESDLIATRRLVEASKIMGISILDHVIVSGDQLASIREKYPAYFDTYPSSWNMKELG